MRSIIQWVSATLGCAFLAGAASAQWTAEFEAPTYSLGQLEGQNIWIDWTGVNTNFTQVVNTQNHTPGGSRAIEIANGADTVADFDMLPGGSFDSGVWTVRGHVLIPNGSVGQVFFLIMNHWDVTGSPAYEWNLQLGLHASLGRARLFTPDGVKETALVVGAWTEIRAEYDLDNDQVAVYYDGNLLHTYDPRCGVTTGCGGPYSGSFIDAIDLYPDPTTNPSPIFFDDFSVEPGTGGPAGQKYCFGVGGTPCPCGNGAGPAEGCGNSTGQGSELDGSGTNSVLADDLVLTAMNALPGQPGLFFQGLNATNGGSGGVFGDGLRCAGTGVVRLGVGLPNASGCIATDGSCGSLPGGPIDIADKGGVMPGDLRHYQFWYRDPIGGPCGSGFNLTNGFRVTWTN